MGIYEELQISPLKKLGGFTSDIKEHLQYGTYS